MAIDHPLWLPHNVMNAVRQVIIVATQHFVEINPDAQSKFQWNSALHIQIAWILHNRSNRIDTINFICRNLQNSLHGRNYCLFYSMIDVMQKCHYYVSGFDVQWWSLFLLGDSDIQALLLELF